MKKTLLLISFILLSANVSQAQEWFKNFDIAKRLALAQNKMLFVLWEEALDYPYPLLVKNENGKTHLIDLSDNQTVDSLIWEHFIPVLLPEYEYNKFIEKAKNKGSRYAVKLNDDSIKIMDINGNILNVKLANNVDQNLSKIIKNYSLNTEFLKQTLINYNKKANFTTTFNLADKYVDYAIFVEEDARYEVVELANIYFKEADYHLANSSLDNKIALAQRIELIKIKESLILDKPRKALRSLKKINEIEIAEINKSLYVFLKYTTFMLLNETEEASVLESKLLEADLSKSKYIIRNNK